jgi:NAD dependent epimerase/dehydratase family enzyme
VKIVIPGGSGQVGTILRREFGDDAVVVSRQGPVGWDDLGRVVDGADVVINLAGRSVNCRYGPENRAAIMDSRVQTTRAIGEAIAAATRPPPVWLQASTATIYADTYGPANDENGTLTPATRLVLMRSAITMSPDRGGPFDVLLGLVRRGLGGTAGHGRQYVSWIHDEDFGRAVRWLIDHNEIAGPVNLAAPEPLPNAQFMRDLRAAWGARVGLPATNWMLEAGAVLMRTETELVLKSRRVVPGRLLADEFEFRWPRWPDAARELCARWRAGGRDSSRRAPRR